MVVAARERGLLIRAIAGHSLQVSPAFVVTEAELSRIGDTVRAALDDSTAGQPGLARRSH